MGSLVEITEQTHDVVLQIAYATRNNVAKKPFYKRAACFLHKDAEEKLQHAIALAKPHGLRIKIFDAFRPLEAQKLFWDMFQDPLYVSPPSTGSVPHTRGVAVDLTLVDGGGNELEMGTEFDAFTPRSHHANIDVSLEAQRNRFFLMGLMTAAGWDFYRNEWWHYQLFKPREYPKLTDKEAGTHLM